jgi:hypothetical protein
MNDESSSSTGYQRTDVQNEHNLGCYLLVTDGNDMVGSEAYGTPTNPGDVHPDNFWPGFQIDLGIPAGARYDWNGFIRRDFADGIVVTREPDIGPATFTVPAGYVPMPGSGHTVSGGTITLDPQTSVVLVGQ